MATRPSTVWTFAATWKRSARRSACVRSTTSSLTSMSHKSRCCHGTSCSSTASVTIDCWGPIYEISYDSLTITLHTFNGPFSGTTRVSQYQKGKTNLDFTEARDGEWQWHKVCTSLQTDNHASTPPLKFLQAGCPSCHPTNSVKALKD